MGACRQGFDLFNRYGRKSAFEQIRRGDWKYVRQYIFRDTLTRFLCKLSGGCHFTWQPDPVEEPEALYCQWCKKRKPVEDPD